MSAPARFVLAAILGSAATGPLAQAQPVPTVATVAPPPPPSAPRGSNRAAPAADLSARPTFQGALTDSDPTSERGSPYDSYTTTVRSGDEVTVTMSSSEFDTYLVVRAPSGREWSNDDFGSTRVSQVSFIAAEAGIYTVIATAYSESARGAYEVRVSALSAVVISAVSGRLDYEDRQQIKGEFYDEVAVRVPSSGTFYVELIPLGFAGYLRVTSPGGTVTRSEQARSSESPSVRLGPFQAERGDWRVDVTSQGSGSMVGAYDVRVITLGRDQ